MRPELDELNDKEGKSEKMQNNENQIKPYRRHGLEQNSTFYEEMAHPKRFELLTPRFVVWCSIQLSYGCVPCSASCRSGGVGLS